MGRIFCCMQCGRSFSIGSEEAPKCCYYDRSKYIFFLADEDALKLGINKETFTPCGNPVASYEFPMDIRFNSLTGESMPSYPDYQSLEGFQMELMMGLWGKK